ncbi:MAG TPA: DUF3999 family protein [Arenimonas sp.]|nr:DUF3999 family protein [Arenimonas sp.]
MRVRTLLLALLLPLSAAASSDQYARHWPLQVNEPGVHAVELTPAIYAQIERADLGDLDAFNAAGEPLAFGPLATLIAQPEPQWRSVQWFQLPATTTGQGDDLSLQIDRGTDGRLSLRAQVTGESNPAATGDLIVDTGVNLEDSQRLLALAFDFSSDAADFSAQVQVESSDDLHRWHGVGSGTVMQLQQNGQLLQRRQLDLGGSNGRYLRLRRVDASAALPVTGISVQTRAAAAPDPRPSVRLAAELVSREQRTFIYRLPGRIPIEEVDLRLAQDNAVAVAQLASREGGRGAWRPRGSLTAFRLRAADVELQNEPLRLGGSRDREWRVELGHDVAEAPVLEFAYRPERWLLLTQGAAPYVIAAGSSRARRTDLPLAALLAPIRAKYGADWQPELAALGEPIVVAGDAAIAPTPQERYSNHALWILLIGSAAAIALMVFRLLREQRPSA